ncbi:hypothetical protein QFZ50_001678 [Arthrobacter agilis]|nr:hypothetical protein [Arthrobacter agilis]
MSIRTTSTSCSIPALTVSKATDAGSAPSMSDLTVGTPTRAPQVASCSAAAARKVSAAPRMTSLSSATSTRASLPTVVVLPTPLTPTTMTMAGRSAWRCVARERSIDGSTSLTSSSRSMSLTSAGLRLPATFTRSRSASTSSMVGSVPRSARRSVSSTSSQTSSSILSRDSRARRPLPSALLDRTRRARNRASRPCTGSTVSRAGSAGASSRPLRSSGTSSSVVTPSGRSRTSVDVAPWAAPVTWSSGSRGEEYSPGGVRRPRTRRTATDPITAIARMTKMTGRRMSFTDPPSHTGRLSIPPAG